MNKILKNIFITTLFITILILIPIYSISNKAEAGYFAGVASAPLPLCTCNPQVQLQPMKPTKGPAMLMSTPGNAPPPGTCVIGEYGGAVPCLMRIGPICIPIMVAPMITQMKDSSSGCSPSSSGGGGAEKMMQQLQKMAEKAMSGGGGGGGGSGSGSGSGSESGTGSDSGSGSTTGDTTGDSSGYNYTDPNLTNIGSDTNYTTAISLTFSASPTTITSGDLSILAWSSTNATSCTGTNFDVFDTSGTTSVFPTETTTYTIICAGSAGSKTASVTVNINGAGSSSNTTSGGVETNEYFNRELTEGMSGPDVTALQQYLNMYTETQVASSGPGSSGEETDYFGPATTAAVKKFQAKYHLPETGVWTVLEDTKAAELSGTDTTSDGTDAVDTTDQTTDTNAVTSTSVPITIRGDFIYKNAKIEQYSGPATSTEEYFAAFPKSQDRPEYLKSMTPNDFTSYYVQFVNAANPTKVVNAKVRFLGRNTPGSFVVSRGVMEALGTSKGINITLVPRSGAAFGPLK
ncbi:MAG: peptidoglycan-binding domain-containing protein [Candidatus Paceibacterota bacterium]